MDEKLLANVNESLSWVEAVINQHRAIAIDKGVSIWEVEDIFGKKMLLPWLKMRVDLLHTIALVEADSHHAAGDRYLIWRCMNTDCRKLMFRAFRNSIGKSALGCPECGHKSRTLLEVKRLDGN